MSALSGYAKKKTEESRIDLTPMLDVVFILLIFFVVTTIQLDLASLPLESQAPLPDQPLEAEMQENILIEIQANNRILFNGERIDSGAVRAHTARILALNPDASVMVQPDEESLANVLVDVVNAARVAGVEDVRVLEQE